MTDPVTSQTAESDPDTSPVTIPERRSLPVVAIVGRPNVGKSALFNRIIGRRTSIVHSESGVTRDRVALPAEWDGKPFLVVDTGGLGFFPGEREPDHIAVAIRGQIDIALASADAVIMVVDIMAGSQPLDAGVADLLRQAGKPVCVAANKADNKKLADEVHDFAGLGFSAVIPISCMHGINIDELLDEATSTFEKVETAEEEAPLRIAIVGRPNVGKSSIINRLLGEERVIVNDEAGTTRDAIDSPFTIREKDADWPAVLVDTAGIKAKRRLKTAVEFFSMDRARRAISRADIVLLVIDGQKPGTAQDKKIARQIVDAGKACIILANKWDLASAEMKQKDLISEIRYRLPFIEYAPLLTCCATSGYNFKQILARLALQRERLDMHIPTPVLNRVIQDAAVQLPAPSSGPNMFKVMYSVFKHNRPPTVLMFVNRKSSCRDAYLTYFAHCLRTAFDLEGMPIVFEVRSRRDGNKSGEQRPVKKSRERRDGRKSGKRR